MYRIITLSLLFFLSLQFFSQSENKTVFPVKCIVKSENKKVKDAVVLIYEKGKLYKTLETSKGIISFELPSNSEYLIEVKKDGFFNKRIAINTKVEGSVNEIPWYDLTMNLVSKNNPGLLEEDYDLLELPIAYIAYDVKSESFYNINKKHTKALMKTIEKSKKKYLKTQ